MPKAASDGGDPKAASDGGDLDRDDTPTAEYLNDDTDLHHGDAEAEFLDDDAEAEFLDDDADLHHEDAAEYIDDADLHHEDADAAEYIDDADGGSDGVRVSQISSPDRDSELASGARIISSPDREANTSGLPARILLDPISIDGDLGYDNATTAEAQTISRREDGVKISFFVANPPCPSHFKIHVPSLVEKPYLLRGRPSILYTVHNLALMSITFGGYPSETEYYLYRVVGPGQWPSLIHLEYVSQQLKKVFHVVKVGLLPRDGDGFVLTALTLEQVKGEQYRVHVFKYEQGTWTSKVHVLEHHQIGNMRLYNVEKVIALLVGELGFVDMWNGILVFNVLEEDFIPRYIPLPKLLPSNHSDQQLGLSAKHFRDVVFSTDGYIRCVELEMCWKHIVHEKEKARPSDKQEICTKAQEDVWESDMLYDADLMHHQNNNNKEVEVEETFQYLGWRFICWSRKPYFPYWRKDCSTHAKDIINTAESLLWGVQLDKLSVSFPTLSVDGSELYLVSKVHATDLESRVIMVDLGKNSIKAFSPFPTKRPDFFQQYIVCDLFKCMNMPSDESHVYDQKALFLRLPLLKHENILSVRTSQSMEPCEGGPVGLQLIQLDDQAPVAYGCWPSDNVDLTSWERVEAKMKLQLSETAAKDSTLGTATAGWERFQFNKDAPIEEDNDDVEGPAAEAMASTPDWSFIPLKAVGLVLEHLPALVDRVSFATVCPQWHLAARRVKLPPALPLLDSVSPTGQYSRQTLHDHSGSR